MSLPSGTRITWYGHSAFRIDTAGGRAIILDPFLENPNSPIKADQIDRCDLLNPDDEAAAEGAGAHYLTAEGPRG